MRRRSRRRRLLKEEEEEEEKGDDGHCGVHCGVLYAGAMVYTGTVVRAGIVLQPMWRNLCDVIYAMQSMWRSLRGAICWVTHSFVGRLGCARRMGYVCSGNAAPRVAAQTASETLGCSQPPFW